MERVTAIRDTREKDNNGYYWSENEWCDGYVTQKLPVADYSLVGYEDVLAIERKASTAEFAQNVNEKRFDRELEKLSLYKYSFIVCEFSFEDIMQFPINSTIPTKLWEKLQVTNKYLLRKIGEYQIKYTTKILFCGNKQNAWEMTNCLFKRTVDLCKR